MNIPEIIKRHAYLILGGACLFVVGLIYVIAVRGGDEPYITDGPREGAVIFDAGEASPAEVPAQYIIVHVTGEVYEPGVFSLPADSRVLDAVAAAGGITASANPHFNLAAPVADGSIIIVPAYYEDVAAPAAAAGIAADGRVNINTASYAELRTLPQIGTARAQAIIAFRDAHGHFATADDLMLVHGIGTGIFNQLADRVTVGP